MSDLVRTFIAIDIPSSIKETIAHAQDELRRAQGAKVSYPRMEGIHLTLKFIGDVERDQLGRVTQAVQVATESVDRFELFTANIGGFPNLMNPRVLWWGIRNSQQLLQLHREIDGNLSEIGFRPERKRFSAHLTVGRVKYLTKDSDLVDRFEQCDLSPTSWIVTDVNVMSSQLRPSGAVYKVVSSIPLG